MNLGFTVADGVALYSLEEKMKTVHIVLVSVHNVERVVNIFANRINAEKRVTELNARVDGLPITILVWKEEAEVE